MNAHTINTEPTPWQSYNEHVDTLRDIISFDHFGGEMPPQIVDQWVKALEPGSKIPLPPSVKGFYGGSLRASMPIEVARASYKYIKHETVDKDKINMYARRMLIVLSVLDLPTLAEQEPNLAALALWHKALAQVRLPDSSEGLGQTLRRYQEVRPRSNLSDSKLPQMERLKIRLTAVATDLGNEPALRCLVHWDP